MSCGSLLYHAILALADKPSVPLGYILLCLCGSAIEQTNAQCQHCGYSCAHMFLAMKYAQLLIYMICRGTDTCVYAAALRELQRLCRNVNVTLDGMCECAYGRVRDGL